MPLQAPQFPHGLPLGLKPSIRGKKQSINGSIWSYLTVEQCTLKMDAASFSETVVSRHHNPEGLDLILHRRGNLKSRKRTKKPLKNEVTGGL
jgi:hypothetical protein